MLIIVIIIITHFKDHLCTLFMTHFSSIFEGIKIKENTLTSYGILVFILNKENSDHSELMEKKNNRMSGEQMA